MLDYSKPAKELLLELIYQSNEIVLAELEVAFGVPELLDQRPDIDSDANSFIPASVDPDWDNRYLPKNGFMYRRAHLSDIAIDPSTPPLAIDYLPCQTSDLLDAINARYGTHLTLDDVENLTYTDANTPVVIKFKEDALCWAGEPVIVPSIYVGLAANYQLNGFVEWPALNPPVP